MSRSHHSRRFNFDVRQHTRGSGWDGSPNSAVSDATLGEEPVESFLPPAEYTGETQDGPDQAFGEQAVEAFLPPSRYRGEDEDRRDEEEVEEDEDLDVEAE